MFFNDDDIAAVHTLAGAARELYEKHCAARGVPRMFETIKEANPDKTEKELWNILNGSRNFLKHPDPSHDLDAALDIDDETNASTLFIACHDCAMLCGRDQPLEVQAFNAWFLATRFPEPTMLASAGDAESTRVAAIQSGLQAALPGLREALPTDQKRIGLRLLEDAPELMQ